MLDSKPNCNENVSFMLKKTNSPVHCLRKFRAFVVNTNMLATFIMLRYAPSLCLGLLVGVGIFQSMTGEVGNIVKKKASPILGRHV